MGTSSSSKGSGSGSPLVPSWADAMPGAPLPSADPRRFRAFRLNLGKFVHSNDSKYLQRAVGHFAKQASGGSVAGPRRFGAITNVGGDLVRLLSELAQGGTGQPVIQIDLSGLAGKDINFAIQEIVQALTPTNGDTERIRHALVEAQSGALNGMEEFDPTAIDDGVLVDMLVIYLCEAVYEQVILESDRAFEKEESPDRIVEAERALHTLVCTSVDKYFRDKIVGGVKGLTPQQVAAVQQQALAEIWKEWEAY